MAAAVIKQAVSFGEAELALNERVRRDCPSVCATFVDGAIVLDLYCIHSFSLPRCRVLLKSHGQGQPSLACLEVRGVSDIS